MSEITVALAAFDAGDAGQANRLLELVYRELKVLAAAKMRHESPGLTLQATALVHEAYLRLVGQGNQQSWANRAHFFTAAAEAMRRILIEQARARNRQKRGGDLNRIDLAEVEIVSPASPDEILRINEAIEQLAREDPLAAKIVSLRFFTGMSVEQIADALDLARSTAYEHWSYARAWLVCYVGDGK